MTYQIIDVVTEHYKIINFIVMNMTFLSFVIYITIKYGILSSISKSYYMLPEKLKILFTLFCWGYAIPAIILGSDLLFLVAGAGIVFVGTSPNYRTVGTAGNVHNYAAMVAIISSQLSILFNFGYWQITMLFLTGSLLLTYLPRKYQKNNVWWQEIFAYISVSTTYALTIF